MSVMTSPGARVAVISVFHGDPRCHIAVCGTPPRLYRGDQPPSSTHTRVQDPLEAHANDSVSYGQWRSTDQIGDFFVAVVVGRRPGRPTPLSLCRPTSRHRRRSQPTRQGSSGRRPSQPRQCAITQHLRALFARKPGHEAFCNAVQVLLSLKRGSNKGDNSTCIKCAVSAKRKALKRDSRTRRRKTDLLRPAQEGAVSGDATGCSRKGGGRGGVAGRCKLSPVTRVPRPGDGRPGVWVRSSNPFCRVWPLSLPPPLPDRAMESSSAGGMDAPPRRPTALPRAGAFLRLRSAILSEEIWTALNIEVLRADEGEARWVWSGAGMQGWGKREIPEDNPLTSGIVRHDSTCANPGATPPEIEYRFALVMAEGQWWMAGQPRHFHSSGTNANHYRVKIDRNDKPLTRGERRRQQNNKCPWELFAGFSAARKFSLHSDTFPGGSSRRRLFERVQALD
ncbi:hypothetical protein PR048_019023 [Dryococelus australis]|uniref:Uncharacterized protein n=1 Tax=Dryococelus australis TaxID=614101 RepID=A0ABQ9H2B6_9NEOP|nr:hypothetical protein PR048_019023 [Dryococelus australis]